MSKLSTNEVSSRQQTLAKECLAAGFRAWQELATAEKTARSAAAELLAHEEKAVCSKKRGKKYRARRGKKLEGKAVDDFELQKCFDGNTSDERHDEQSGSCSYACLLDCVKFSTGCNSLLNQATGHLFVDAHGEHDSSKNTNLEEGCLLELDIHDEGLVRTPQARNTSCPCAMLPSMPSRLVAFDAEVRNTFLHIPLPESSEKPPRRALSAPPGLGPSSVHGHDLLVC